MNPETPKSEETMAPPIWSAMREPPGRLGDIVRRLKQTQPLPLRMVPLVAAVEPQGE